VVVETAPAAAQPAVANALSTARAGLPAEGSGSGGAPVTVETPVSSTASPVATSPTGTAIGTSAGSPTPALTPDAVTPEATGAAVSPTAQPPIETASPADAATPTLPSQPASTHTVPAVAPRRVAPVQSAPTAV